MKTDRGSATHAWRESSSPELVTIVGLHPVARGPKAGFLGETPSEIDGLSAQISVVNVAETI